MAVVDFQTESRQCGAVQTSGVVVRTVQQPTARFGPASVLLPDQFVPEAFVPELPRDAAVVMQHLGGIVFEVQALIALGELHQPVDSGLNARMIALPTGVHAAEQADGGGRRRRIGRLVIEMAAVGVPVAGTGRVVGDGIQESNRLFDRAQIHRQAGQMAAAECHQLPTEHRGVAGLLGRIAPSAAGMLRQFDETDGPLSGVGQFPLRGTHSGRFRRIVWIVRHRQGLAQSQGSQAVAVHGAARIHQAALARLQGDQVLQTVRDGLAVIALQMRVSGAQQGQQHQSGCTVLGCGTARRRAGAIPAPMIALAVLKTPGTVAALMFHQPAKRQIDGMLAVHRPALSQCLPPALCPGSQFPARNRGTGETAVQLAAGEGFAGRSGSRNQQLDQTGIQRLLDDLDRQLVLERNDLPGGFEPIARDHRDFDGEGFDLPLDRLRRVLNHLDRLVADDRPGRRQGVAGQDDQHQQMDDRADERRGQDGKRQKTQTTPLQRRRNFERRIGPWRL